MGRMARAQVTRAEGNIPQVPQGGAAWKGKETCPPRTSPPRKVTLPPRKVTSDRCPKAVPPGKAR